MCYVPCWAVHFIWRCWETGNEFPWQIHPFSDQIRETSSLGHRLLWNYNSMYSLTPSWNNASFQYSEIEIDSLYCFHCLTFTLLWGTLFEINLSVCIAFHEKIKANAPYFVSCTLITGNQFLLYKQRNKILTLRFTNSNILVSVSLRHTQTHIHTHTQTHTHTHFSSAVPLCTWIKVINSITCLSGLTPFE